MKFPPPLQAGDTVAITCPSGYLPAARTVFAQQTLEAWGFRVRVGATVGHEYFYFSDTDEGRLLELQQFLDDKKVKAILMGRGGYGLSRIIDRLDFTSFKRHPKWICGFSDITVLHSHLHARLGIASLHGPMCAAFKDVNEPAAHLQSVRKALTGVPIDYPITGNRYNRTGVAEGQLVGGNLAILAHLSGSASQMKTKGKLLFLEDIGEYLYNMDRMLYNLKRAGMFDQLAGLVLGGFSDMKDTERPFGQDIYEIILDKVKEYDYPVCFEVPSGHLDVNYTLCLGQNYRLDVGKKKVKLEQLS